MDIFNRRIAILKQAFKGDMPKYSPSEIRSIEVAMVNYAASEVVRFKDREIKGEMKSFWKLLVKFSWDNALLYARSKVFKKAKRQARLRAETEGRKIYVIRKSAIGYQLMSTLDVQHNKRVRILDKDVDAMTMEQMSDFIATPKNSLGDGRKIPKVRNKATNVQPKKKRTKRGRA